MEARREESGFLDKLRPPRLEDAGLEDCALPPESIREAFLKAATAIRSGSASSLTTDDDKTDATDNDCVRDPRRVTKEPSDSMIGNWPESYPPPGHCEAKKGVGEPEVLGDEVAASVTDAEERLGTKGTDSGGEACVDGLKGLKIEDPEG